MTDCYKLGLGNRTVYDKLAVVLQVFKRFGKAKLIEPSDWPDYVEKIRPIYAPEEIRAMLRLSSLFATLETTKAGISSKLS